MTSKVVTDCRVSTPFNVGWFVGLITKIIRKPNLPFATLYDALNVDVLVACLPANLVGNSSELSIQRVNKSFVEIKHVPENHRLCIFNDFFVGRTFKQSMITRSKVVS